MGNTEYGNLRLVPYAQVKARFACYWGAIRPASGWIRRRTLLAVQQKLAMRNS